MKPLIMLPALAVGTVLVFLHGAQAESALSSRRRRYGVADF